MVHRKTMPDGEFPIGRGILFGCLLVRATLDTDDVLLIAHQGHGRLCQYLFLHHNIAFVIELAFVPEGAVRRVVFARSGANCQLPGSSLVVRPSLISACLRGFAFRIWHNNSIYYGSYLLF
jgi:hypothetical protein